MIRLRYLSIMSLLLCVAAPAYSNDELEAAEIVRKTESAVAAERFDELEGMARDFRNPDVRVTGGNSKLYHFYGALSGYAGSSSRLPNHQSETPFSSQRQLIENWLHAKPKSIAARIALAELWSKYAWQGRGTEYAAKVTPDQWKSLAEGLETASSYLSDLDPESDPHAYDVLMYIAGGTSGSRKRLDALYEKAIHSNPRYFHYYSLRAHDLRERWFGRKGELADYVQSVLIRPGWEDGFSVKWRVGAPRL